jgi:DNA-binding NtrC family response regulator
LLNNFQTEAVCILSDCEEFALHRFRQVQDRKYRILYAGNDLRLLKYLEDKLKDCHVVRAPSGYVARTLIKGESGYSLFLFDKELPDTTASELESYTHMHRESVPVIIFKSSDKFRPIVKTIISLLSSQVPRRSYFD